MVICTTTPSRAAVRLNSGVSAHMKNFIGLLVASCLIGCAISPSRSINFGIEVGDQLRTDVSGAITTCYEWKATSPFSTRQEHVPCLASGFSVLPEDAIRVDAGTTVTVVKITELGLVDSQSTQVFVKVPGYDQTFLVSMGDIDRLFKSRNRCGH